MFHRARVSLFISWHWITFAVFLSGAAAAQSNSERYSASGRKFRNPQAIDIKGLPDGVGGTPISTEEPFLSRDGRFLFFNTGEHENNKDLHYAEWVRAQWIYRGQIGPNVNNSKEVQGNPSMDRTYNFFYVDSGVKAMVRIGRFLPDRGELILLRDLDGVPKRKVKFFAQKIQGNMGVEVSADGTILFFSRATWKLHGFRLGMLKGSDILFVRKRGDKYVYDYAEAKRIMKHINTSDLEYAASISSDKLELFFTRLRLADFKTGTIRSRIMRSTRSSVSDTFGKPEVIEAIGGSDFVEGPAISGDGRELYYHKHDGKKFRIYKVTR